MKDIYRYDVSEYELREAISELLKENKELSFDDYLYYVREFQTIRFRFVKYFAKFIKSEKSMYDKES